MTVPYVVKPERTTNASTRSEITGFVAEDEGTTTDDSEEWALFEAPPCDQPDTSSDAMIARSLQAQFA